MQTIQFIDANTVPSQKLFVAVPKHDRIFANDMLIYFAAQRAPATKWAHFDPDLQDRYDIQAEIVRELETDLPPYIVVDSQFDYTNEPNDSSRSSGVTFLDDYIHGHYHRVQKFGDDSILERNSDG